MTDMNRENE